MYRLIIRQGIKHKYNAKIQKRFKMLWLTVASEEWNTKRECKNYYKIAMRGL